jgi:hypothetical protein
MGLFGKKETLNEQMLREAHLEPEAVRAADHSDEVLGIWLRAMARPGEYDTVVTVQVTGIEGSTVEFATLPDGDVIVDTEDGDADLSPFADAVEKTLQAPYRVSARRGEGGLWTVAARGIDVLELQFSVGDEIELASIQGKLEIRVDGEPWQGTIPELERAAEAADSDDYVVQAERLDGDFWEVRASPL